MAYDDGLKHPKKNPLPMSRGNGAPFVNSPLSRTAEPPRYPDGASQNPLEMAGRIANISRPAPAPLPTMNTGAPTPPPMRGGQITNVSRPAPAPLPPTGPGMLSRSNVAPAPAPVQPTTPQIPAAFGIAPYGRPSFMPQGAQQPSPGAPLASAIAPTAVSPNTTPANTPTQAEMQRSKSSLEAALPQSPQNQARRQASSNPMISDVERGAAAQEGRNTLSRGITSGGVNTVADAMKGGATEQQALDMGMSRGTPRVTPGQIREGQLLTGSAGRDPLTDGATETDRQAAREQFAKTENKDKAKAAIANKNEGFTRDSTQGKAAKARGEANFAKAKESDRLRRSTDPLTLMNIARGQERSSQLAEKRTVAEQKGAANRMMANAMSQSDPRVRAQMTAQAGELAKAVSEREPARRTTYGDILNQQKAEAIAFKQAGATSVKDDARSQRDVADAEKTRAETKAIRDAMPPERQVQLDNATRKHDNDFDAWYVASDSDKPALKEAMDKSRNELDAIVNQTATAPASGMTEGRTGMKNGRAVIVRGGTLVYVDDGKPAQ